MSIPASCDVIVVGSGNAGFSAAVSAAQSGARRVLLVDKCPEDWAGGNSYFTAGAYRTVHQGLEDLLPLVNNVSSSEAEKIELKPYTAEDFHNDLKNVCAGHSDPDLAGTLVADSNETIKWLA